MKGSAGNTKVLLIAFGHPDNVLSLANAVSDKVDLNLIFVVAGDTFRQGILDINIQSLPYGLSDQSSALNLIPANIREFIGDKFTLRFIRTPTRKLIRKGALVNYLSIYRPCKILNSEKYDTLHFNGISGFIIFFRLFLTGFRKKIWTIHDFKPHTGEENQKSMLFQRIAISREFEYIQHYEYLKKNFLSFYKIPETKVHQVYSGPFNILTFFKPVFITEKTSYFLFFGRISKYKGIEFLINSYSNYNSLTKPELIIAGNGKLDFDITDCNMDRITIINRYITSEEMIGLIKNSLAIVIPYSDSTHSGVVATAYAFNKPVIATNVGGLSEVVINNETGYLINKDDENSLVQTLENISNNPEILQYFQKNIYKLCSEGKLSWSKISLQMKDIYRC